MSKQLREYLETALAAVEQKAARFRTALEVLDEYEVEVGNADPPKAGPKAKPASRSGKPPAGTRGKAGKKICTRKGCTSVVVAKGLCRKHYDQANPKSARSTKEKDTASEPASTAAEGEDPDSPAPEGASPPAKGGPPTADPALIAKAKPQAEQRLPKNRVPCGHPHCDASVPFTGGIPDEPMYCSDFCMNNHKRMLQEASAN